MFLLVELVLEGIWKKGVVITVVDMQRPYLRRR